MRRIVYRTCQINFFWKKIQLFFQITPPVFQENPKFETFENFQAKIPFETHSIEILPMSSFFRKFRRFSQITDLLSQKSQTVEHFQTSWEIVILKRKLEVKCHFYRFCTEKDLFKNNIYFSEKTKGSIVLSLPKQYESLTTILDKKWRKVLLKSSIDFFT